VITRVAGRCDSRSHAQLMERVVRRSGANYAWIVQIGPYRVLDELARGG